MDLFWSYGEQIYVAHTRARAHTHTHTHTQMQLSVGQERVRDLSYEIPADCRLLDLTVKAFAQNGDVFSGPYTLSLGPRESRGGLQSMCSVVPGLAAGELMMQGIEIPVAPGSYDVSIVAKVRNPPSRGKSCLHVSVLAVVQLDTHTHRHRRTQGSQSIG